MTNLVLIPRHTAAEVTSFALPQECMTLEAANRLVAVYQKHLDFGIKMKGARSKFAKAWGNKLMAARFRVAELNEQSDIS